MSVDQSSVTVGQTIAMTIVVTNTDSTETANSVVVTDNLPSELSVVNASLYVDGVHQPGEPITSGVLLGDMVAGASYSIFFYVNIVSSSDQSDSYSSSCYDSCCYSNCCSCKSCCKYATTVSNQSTAIYEMSSIVQTVKSNCVKLTVSSP